MPSQIMPTVNLLKLPDPAAQTAKYVNMMNATKQQEAAERQAAMAEKTFGLAEQRNQREADLQAATLTEKGQAAKESNMKRLRDLSVVVLNTEDPNTREAAYQNLLGLIDKTDDQLSAMMRQVAPTFNADILESAIMNVDTYFAKKYPNATASVDYTAKGGKDAQGNPVPENIPVQITTGRYPSTKVIRNAPETAASTPVPTAAPPPTTPGPVPVGKYGETRVRPDNATPLTPDMQADIDRIKKSSGMVNTPASFTPGSMGTPTAGQMSPDMVPAILDSAVKTGVMAQIDLDQMLALAPPQARDGIMQVIRDSKIALQADAPSLAASAMSQQQPMAPNPVGRQQSTYADMRSPAPQASFADLGGQPQVQNTMAQYQPVQPRNREVSPIPGIYSVPTGQVAATSQAQRETPGEVYAKEKARAKAQREALLEAGPKPLTVPQEAKLRDSITKDYKSARSTIDMMLNPVAGVVAAVNNVRKLSPDQKEAITGYSGYLPTMYASTKSADTAVKNLKGKVTEMGKSVAALTGAIGQMAVQEWRIVSDMIANLDLEGMGAADLDNQLDIIEAQARRAATVTRDAYENQYVEEFDRYPGRFRLPDASAFAAPAAKRRTPTKGAVDRNNPLLRN